MFLPRYRASTLRRLLAVANLTYSDLEAAWKDNKAESLTKLVHDRVTQVRKPEDLEDLTETLLGHFDAEYQPKISTRPPRRVSFRLELHN